MFYVAWVSWGNNTNLYAREKCEKRKVSEHKLLAIYVQKHSFSNIACKLWKLKFPEAC